MIKFLDLRLLNSQYERELKEAAHRVIDSGWYLLGRELEDFEKKYSNINLKTIYLFNQKFVESDNNIDIIKALFANGADLYIKNEEGDFISKIFKEDKMIIEGVGKSKKKAEQDVSRKALIHFNVLT